MSERRKSDGNRHRLRELAVSWALRLSKGKVGSQKRMIAIVGDHIGDQIRSHGIYEREQLEYLRDQFLDLKTCGRQTALDVGANIGNHSLFLSDLFAHVIAFEPNPIALGILKLNLQLNEIGNVDVRPFGLSDRTGSAELVIPDDNIGAASMADVATSVSGTAAKISLCRGDDVLDQNIQIGLIKIDVEGAESAVLDGLRETILRNRPLIVLEQLANAINGSTGQSKAFSMLRKLGYEAWELARGGLSRRIAAVLHSANSLHVVPVLRLQSRDYPMLLFRPTCPNG